jgi:hypothetical protein
MHSAKSRSSSPLLTRQLVLVIAILGAVLGGAFIGVSVAYPGLLPLDTLGSLIAGVGTFALAVVALYALAVESEAREQDRLDRRAERAPHLVIRAISIPHRRKQGSSNRPSLGQIFNERALAILNDGLGPARSLTWRVTIEEIPLGIAPEDVPAQPIDEDSGMFEYEVDPDDLGGGLFHAGEQFQIVAVNMDRRPVFPPDEPQAERVRVVVEATARSLDNQTVYFAMGGLKHRRRWTEEDHPRDDVAKDIEFHATRSRWYPMSEIECRAVLRRTRRQRDSDEKLAEEARSDDWGASWGRSVHDHSPRKQ